MNKQNDNFEAIAKDAVAALTAVIMTLRITGGEEYRALTNAIRESAEKLIDRAIALGGE